MKDIMFSVTPTYSAYIYKEIAEIWEKKFSFIDGKNSDSLRWYDWMKCNKGKGNCPDYGMYVAYIASKLHNAKVVVVSMGLEKNNKTSQFSYRHIIPIYYEDSNWVLVNYVGVDGPSIIYTFSGKDDIETVTKFVNQYSKEWLLILANHIKLDYDTCDKVIKIATVEKVKSTLNKYYGQNITQSKVLDYLFI